jgi:hypothetical protein
LDFSLPENDKRLTDNFEAVAKTILKFSNEDEFDFLLVGIVCQQKDFRLCHELNRQLALDLKRKEDFEIRNTKRMKNSVFSFFQYENKDADIYYIFSNKGKDDFLLPEHRNVDYLMMIKENFKRIKEQYLIDEIKKIPSVLGAYALEVKKLKSKGNLIF